MKVSQRKGMLYGCANSGPPTKHRPPYYVWNGTKRNVSALEVIRGKLYYWFVR